MLKSLYILLMLTLVGCLNDVTLDKQKVLSATTKASTYVADAAIIISIIPTIEEDINNAFSKVGSLSLTEDEKVLLAKSELETRTLIQDIKKVISLRKEDIGDNLIYISKLDSYIGLTRAVYKDVKSVVKNHIDELNAVDLYRLQQLDEKLQMLNSSYKHLIESNIDKADVTDILMSTLTLAGSTANLVTLISNK